MAFMELFLRFVYAPEAVKNRIALNRLAGTPRNFQNSFDEKAFRFIPGSKGEMAHPEYELPVTHDDFGFRNPCYTGPQKNSYALLIGDSYVYGLGVDDQHTFSCLLNAGAGQHFYTMGIPGASPAQYLRMLKTHSRELIDKVKIDPLQPLYVMLFLGNDFEDLLALVQKPASAAAPPSAFEQPGASIPLLRRLNDMVTLGFLSQSYFAQSIKLAVLNLKLVKKSTAEYQTNYAGSTFYTRSAPLKVTESGAALVYFTGEAKALGYPSVTFVLVPDACEVDPVRLRRDASIGQFDADQINVNFKFDSLEQACRKLQISCIDTRPALMPKADGKPGASSQLSPDYYISDGHLRATGVERVSDYLRSVLDRPEQKAMRH